MVEPDQKEAPEVCSACAVPLHDGNDGLELWGSRFCSGCFIGNAARLDRPMSPEDLAQLRRLGRELAGFLPPELLEMIFMGFKKRTEGLYAGVELRAELARAVGEVQRLTAFACMRQSMSMLQNWKTVFDEFVEGQEAEARDRIRRLADMEGSSPIRGGVIPHAYYLQPPYGGGVQAREEDGDDAQDRVAGIQGRRPQDADPG